MNSIRPLPLLSVVLALVVVIVAVWRGMTFDVQADLHKASTAEVSAPSPVHGHEPLEYEDLKSSRESIEEAKEVPGETRLHQERKRSQANLLVRVRSSSGGPVSSGRILLKFFPGERVREREVDLDSSGEFAFQGLMAGKYEVSLLKEGLEPGFLPTRWNKRGFGPGLPGFGPEVVELQAGDDKTLDLLALQSSNVIGRVLGPEGEPVKNASFRLQNTGRGFSGVASMKRTDEAGEVLLSGVYPGHYITRVSFDSSYDSGTAPDGRSYGELAQPMRSEITLEPGSSGEVVVQLLQGPIDILGRVIDQDGKGAEGFKVLCYYGVPQEESLADQALLGWGDVAVKTWTDERGGFLLKGVHPERIAILPDPMGYIPSRPVGDNRLGRASKAVYLDLRKRSGELRLEKDLEIYRSRPFRISGRVEIDPTWGSGRPLQINEIELKVWRDDHRTWVPRGPHDMRRSERIELDEAGHFEWACETPRDYLGFEIRVNRPSAPVVLIEDTEAVPELVIEDFVLKYP